MDDHIGLRIHNRLKPHAYETSDNEKKPNRKLSKRNESNLVDACTDMNEKFYGRVMEFKAELKLTYCTFRVAGSATMFKPMKEANAAGVIFSAHQALVRSIADYEEFLSTDKNLRALQDEEIL